MPRQRRQRAASAAIGIALIGLLAAFGAGAESVRILVQRSPLAGSQYHALATVVAQIRVGDTLTLTREPGNRHDRNAVRVDWRDQPLGYVPRRENRALAQALDAGERLEARVSALRDDADPWRRVEFDVYLRL